ncbi:MAG: (2Fe-2S)-binding protein [Nonomuraea sp.]|nr:(2Fe-2S)-binding protein [Nonomuraea sp.]
MAGLAIAAAHAATTHRRPAATAADTLTSVGGAVAGGVGANGDAAALNGVAGDGGGSVGRGPGVPERLVRRRGRLRAFGRALQRAYPVRPGWQGWLTPGTLVCRCEEVTLDAVREAQAMGATDARSIKLLARPGMGWCQGRMCGYAVSCLAGEAPQAPRRPVVQPITLGALERTDDDEPR